MRSQSADQRTGLPWVQDVPGVGQLFSRRTRVAKKTELVILIKPTVIKSSADTAEDVAAARERIFEMLPPAKPGSAP